MSKIDKNDNFFDQKKHRRDALRPNVKFVQRKSFPESFCPTKTILPEHRTERRRSESRRKQTHLAKKALLALLKLVRSETVSGPREDGQERESVDAEREHSAVRSVRHPTRHELGNRRHAHALPGFEFRRWQRQLVRQRTEQQQRQKQLPIAQALRQRTGIESGRKGSPVRDEHDQL